VTPRRMLVSKTRKTAAEVAILGRLLTVLTINRVLDLFRYGWIHLRAVIVEEDSISRQSSIRSIQIWSDSLTLYNSKGGQYQPSIEYSIYSDIVEFTYPLVIVKKDIISRQSSIRSIHIWLDSLTGCNSMGGQYQPSIEY
jgi:hypothetical protein